MAVQDLRESASTRTSTLQHEMSTMQDSTSSVKSEWNVHMVKTESSYHEDTSSVESGKKAMQEVLLSWCERSYSFIITEVRKHRALFMHFLDLLKWIIVAWRRQR